MYRVEGVSGLNVLTGIKIQSVANQPLEASATINPAPSRESVIGPAHVLPFTRQVNRSAEYNNGMYQRNKFFAKNLRRFLTQRRAYAGVRMGTKQSGK